MLVEWRNRNGLDVEVDGVIVRRGAEALRVEEHGRVGLVAVKDELSFAHQANVVDELDEFARRMMHGENDGLAALRQLPHALHNRDGHEAVQATRRLIEK